MLVKMESSCFCQQVRPSVRQSLEVSQVILREFIVLFVVRSFVRSSHTFEQFSRSLEGGRNDPNDMCAKRGRRTDTNMQAHCHRLNLTSISPSTNSWGKVIHATDIMRYAMEMNACNGKEAKLTFPSFLSKSNFLLLLNN